MNKSYLVSVAFLSMLALNATAQKVNEFGKIEHKTSGYTTSCVQQARVSVDELLACPEGTVLGGEFKESSQDHGIQSSDLGRPDFPTKVYQSFEECYQTINGLRVIGLFNYYDGNTWVACNERGGIKEGSVEMTEPIDFDVEFYRMGSDGKPGEMVYKKTISALGEFTGVQLENDYNLYTFSFDLDETLKLESGFFSVAATDKGDAPTCWFSLFTTGSVPGYGFFSMGSDELISTFLPACYCLKGNGDYIAEKSLKIDRIVNPSQTASGMYEKVQVELVNIGTKPIEDACLELWAGNKLLATESVNAVIKPYETYTYQFKQRIDCSHVGTNSFKVRNITQGDEKIADLEKPFDTFMPEEGTACESASEDFSYGYISSVEIGDIKCTSDGSTYSDYRDMETIIHLGDTLELNVTADVTSTGVWIDWDNNGYFGDKGEFMGEIENKPLKIFIPEIARVAPGKKLMRLVASLYTPEPCGIYYYGETEDYTLVVEPASDSPLLECTTKVMNETLGDNQSKNVALNLTNNGKAVLDGTLSYTYLLPGSPNTNYVYEPDRNLNDVPENAPRFVRGTAQTAEPESDDDTKYTLRYDNGLVSTIAVSNSDVATHATYYPGSMLSTLNGMYISSVDVYIPTAARKSSVVIFGQGTQKKAGPQLLEQEFTSVENSWNRVVLDKPIRIENEDLWIGVKLEGFERNKYYIGIDYSASVKGYGDLVNIGQEVWWSMSDLGVESNFCIRTNVIGDAVPGISWLGFDKTNFSIQPNATETINAAFSTQGLEDGLYEAVAEIKTNDGLSRRVIIPVYLTKGNGTTITHVNSLKAKVAIENNTLHLVSDTEIRTAMLTDIACKTRVMVNANDSDVSINLDTMQSGIYVLLIKYADGTSETVKLPVLK